MEFNFLVEPILKQLKIVGYYFISYFNVLINHHHLVLFITYIFITALIVLILLITNRLKDFNINHQVLYQKNLSHHEKVLFDKPDNFILTLRMGNYLINKILLSMVGLFVFSFVLSGVIFYLLLGLNNSNFFILMMHKMIVIIIAISIGIITSVLIYYLLIRVSISNHESQRSNRSINNSQNDNLSDIADIRDIKKTINKLLIKDYNPIDIFEKNKIIFGMSENNQKNFILKEEYDKTHLLLLGKSGEGKGKVIASIARQLIQNEEDILIIFDPKIDSWLYNVIRDFGDQNLYCIDLNEEIAQINPFKNIKKNDFIEIMNATFDLEYSNNSGSDAYMSVSRKVINHIANNYLNPDLPSYKEKININIIYSIANGILEDLKKAKERLNIQVLENKLYELKLLKAINTNDGLDLEKILNQKSIIFIRGSLKNEMISSGQKLILNRIINLLEKRKDYLRHASIVLDELPTFLSKSLLTTITTARDKNFNFIMAHTSFGDYERTNFKGVQKIIVDNTIKLIFKIEDVETAKNLSETTGQIRYKRNQEEMDLAENYRAVKQKKLRQYDDYRNYIHHSVFSSLKPNTSIFIGNELPKINIIGTIKVKKYDFNINHPNETVNDENNKKNINKIKGMLNQ